MDDKLNILIGENIKNLRKERKLDQETVAFCCGLTRVSILNMEAGRQQLTANMACKLATLFQCEYTDLFPPLSVHQGTIKNAKLGKKAKLMAKLKSMQETIKRLETDINNER
jgi:transcriptional regulator with XRE-family HTH domain